MSDVNLELVPAAPEVGSATARDAAEAIYEFAKKYGLISSGEGPAADVEDEKDDDDQPQPAARFEQHAVIAAFRKRPIQLVGYNERDRVVTVFTDRPLGVRQKKNLPSGMFGTVNVQYMSSGPLEVRGSDAGAFAGEPYQIVGDRYACGSSIFPANRMGAGTLGALVRGTDGALLGLSNNHVTGACNHSELGLPILAPAPADVAPGRQDPFTIGRHLRLCPIHDGHPGMIRIDDNLDAAVFSINNDQLVTSMQGPFYDTPSTTLQIEPGMRVEKVGRSTGRTLGTVVSISVAPQSVFYDVKEFNVKKHVFFPAEDLYIAVGDGDNLFSAGGDSGSLVTHVDEAGTRHAVGLVFAGNDRMRTSIIAPINKVLAALNVTLVSGHGTP